MSTTPNDPGTALTNYTPMDLDALDEQERSIGFQKGGGQFYQFKDGRNVIRVMPGKNGRQPFAQFFKHFVKGAEGGKAWGGPCPNKMAKLPCPVCQVAAKLSRGTDTDRELAGELTPRQRVLAVIMDRASPDAGPQTVEFGPSVYNQVKDIMRNLGEDPTAPDDGFDLIVEKTGSGLRTEYKVTPKRNNSPLHADPRQAKEWREAAPDLGQYVVVQSEAEIATRLGGTVLGHLLATRGQAAAKPATARAKPSAAAAPDDDDDLAY